MSNETRADCPHHESIPLWEGDGNGAPKGNVVGWICLECGERWVVTTPAVQRNLEQQLKTALEERDAWREAATTANHAASHQIETFWLPLKALVDDAVPAVEYAVKNGLSGESWLARRALLSNPVGKEGTTDA